MGRTESPGQAIWRQNHRKAYTFNVMLTTEFDLYLWLEGQEHRQTYIKRLIREDMERVKSQPSEEVY